MIDHLNAEIGLGTITNASSAKKWLSGTFLYVRLKENPERYKIDGDPTGRSLDERLENICAKGLASLEAHDLVNKIPKLHCTEFGDAMARYYLQFDTMKIFLALPQKAKISEILSAIAQAAEFKDVRLKAWEKQAYKDLNKNPSIKFPLPGTLDTAAHKISLVIQSVLGAIDLPSEEYKQRHEYNAAKATIFNNVNRLVRCIIDCQLYLEDSIAARNALALARSLGAQVWDDSPLHIKQLEGIGLVSVRKLVGVGIKSIDDLENTEAHRIETALLRNPPFGTQVLEKVRAFPKLRVSIQMVGEPTVKKGQHVTVKLKAELGFLNDKVPITFQRKPVYVCLLAETSDGRMIHFARIGAKKLDKGQDVLFSANLTSASQTIRAYVMCDDVAGTARHAILKPTIPSSAFPPAKAAGTLTQAEGPATTVQAVPKRRASENAVTARRDDESDEFGDAGIDDADLAQAEADTFMDIDDLDMTGALTAPPPKKKQKTNASTEVNVDWQPTQLASGKWACNHACKDKSQCKHLCCREGVDKPKPPKPTQKEKTTGAQSDMKQTQLGVPMTKKTSAASSTAAVAKSIERPVAPKSSKQIDAKEVRELDRLHNSVKSKTPKVPILGQCKAGKASASGSNYLSFLDDSAPADKDERSTDYGADPRDSGDLPSVGEIVGTPRASRMSPTNGSSGFDDGDDEMLDDAYDYQNSDQTGDAHLKPTSYANTNWEHGRNAQQRHAQRPFNDTPPDLHAPKTKPQKDAHLFVGYSTDSAANDLGLTQSQAKHSSFEGPPSAANNATARPKSVVKRSDSAELRAETARFNDVFRSEDFLADLKDEEAEAGKAETKEDKPSSPDSLKKWVMEEFGTEDFNIMW